MKPSRRAAPPPRRVCRRCAAPDLAWIAPDGAGGVKYLAAKPAGEPLSQVVIGTDGLCQRCRPPARPKPGGQKGLFG